MPNRLLKEGIVDSEKIDALTPQAEVFFYRLLVISDDYGRMDARPAILKARCFPLKDYSHTKIETMLSELAQAGLIMRYQVGGRGFLQIENWSQRQRSHAKYPDPSDGQAIANDAQIAAALPTIADDGQPLDSQLSDKRPSNDGLGLGLGKGKGKGKGLGGAARAHQLPESFGWNPEHEALAKSLGVNIVQELQQFQDYHQAKGSTMKDWDAALRTWIRNAARFSKGKTNKPGMLWNGIDKQDYTKGVNEDGSF